MAGEGETRRKAVRTMDRLLPGNFGWRCLQIHHPVPETASSTVLPPSLPVAHRFVQTMRTRLVPIVTRRGPMMGFRLPPTACAECGSIAHEDVFDTSSSRGPAWRRVHRFRLGLAFICGCTARNASGKHQDKTVDGTQVSGETQLLPLSCFCCRGGSLSGC